MSNSHSFSLPFARDRFFTKEQFAAYQNAWKTLTTARKPLSSTFYAAHAVLTGRDLYKAFSPSKRPHQREMPYQALGQALEELSRIRGVAKTWQCKFAGLSDEQNEALRTAFLAAADALYEIDVTYAPRLREIVTGIGRFPQATVEA